MVLQKTMDLANFLDFTSLGVSFFFSGYVHLTDAVLESKFIVRLRKSQRTDLFVCVYK